jgi:hypothetical protein
MESLGLAGNFFPLKQEKKTLTESGIDTSIIWMNIEDILVKTILSIEDKLYKASENHVPYRNNCFSLLGFDILVDAKLKPWLLEVNLNPSLACDSDLDFRIKSKLMADLFTLVGINPTDQREVDDHKVNRNMFAYMSPYHHDKVSAVPKK